jgi:predicted DNA-binding protein YlxM (UPF0122 family)
MSRLTATDYTKAATMWASGDYTLDELSEKFDITPTALHRRFKREGIEKGQSRQKLNDAIEQSMDNQANKKAAELIEMASQVKELHLKGSQMLSRRLLYEINQATKDGKRLASIRDDIRAIQDASKTLEANYRISERVLRLDREETPDDEIPELIVRRMTDSDVQIMRDAQSQEIEEMTSGFDSDDVTSEQLEDGNSEK